MISLIIGSKGSGKTKRLIEEVEKRFEQSNGHVVCLEAKPKLTYDIVNGVRLLAAVDYGIDCYNSLYGFLSGICATDSDTTDILVDQTIKIGGEDREKLLEFIEKVGKLSEVCNTNFVFAISSAEEDLPKEIFYTAEKM
ncbi:MAG: hypothetical protein Q4E28_03985 [Clostridia bacterium]|nr:hypothetical protein [Clostridia bacterium]